MFRRHLFFILFFSLFFTLTTNAEENADSAAGASQAADMSDLAKDQAAANANDYNQQANNFENSRLKYQSLANKYFATGDTVNGNAALATANQFAASRDDARQKAREERGQAAAWEDAEVDEMISETARQMGGDSTSEALPEETAATESEAGTAATTAADGSKVQRVTEPITGATEGKVAVDNPSTVGSHIVCDGGNCRSIDGNAAMQNSYIKWKTADPNDTYAVQTFRGMMDAIKQLPEGEPLTIAAHGAENGIVLDSESNIRIIYGSAEYDEFVNVLKNHPVTFESCSLASVTGFCSGIAEVSGSPVIAYDKTMYLGTDHMFASDPYTNRHTWQSSDEPVQPGQIIQGTTEVNGAQRQEDTPVFQSQTVSANVGMGAVNGPQVGAFLPFLFSTVFGGFSAAQIGTKAALGFANPTVAAIKPDQSQPAPSNQLEYSSLLSMVQSDEANAGQSVLQSEIQDTNNIIGFITGANNEGIKTAANSPSQVYSNQANLNGSDKMVVTTPLTLFRQMAEMTPTGSLGFLLK